jgi:hypothetical protein
MSGSPKKPEPSVNERTTAAVAQAEYSDFKENYGPLLLEQRDATKSKDNENIARGRTNADTMQAASKLPTLASNGQIALNTAGLISDAQTNQQGAARAAALGATNDRASQVLNTARGQGQVAMGSMETLSNIDTAKGLAKLRDQQTITAAKNAALGEVAGAALLFGAKKGAFGKNMKTGAEAYLGGG